MCRRHRCAHRPDVRTPTQRCRFTEYQDRYKNHPFTGRRQPFRPEYAVKASTVPLDGQTMYKNTYKPHTYHPPGKREREKYMTPEGRMADESTYKHDYPGRVVPPAESAKPPLTYYAHDKPFDGSTVHHDTYRPWDLNLCKVNSMKPDSTPKARDGKMDGRTIFQTDYPGYYTARQLPIRPPNSDLQVARGPMEKDTTTRLDYTKKVVIPAKSAKPPERRPATCEPFKRTTTFQDDFLYRGSRPPASFKPKQDVFTSKVPLEDETTTGVTYRKWAIPRRQPREKESYRPPSARFATDTTFMHDYPKWCVPPADSAKPPMQSFASNQPFDDRTTHRDAYKQWELQAARMKAREEYRPPSGVFQGESTMRSHYRGQYAPASKPVRHEVQRAVGGDMDLNTTYKDTFTGERPQTCPATKIRQWESTPNAGYLYTHDTKGHSFYMPISETVQPIKLTA